MRTVMPKKEKQAQGEKNKSDIYTGKVEVSLLISLLPGCFFMGQSADFNLNSILLLHYDVQVASLKVCI